MDHCKLHVIRLGVTKRLELLVEVVSAQNLAASLDSNGIRLFDEVDIELLSSFAHRNAVLSPKNTSDACFDERCSILAEAVEYHIPDFLWWSMRIEICL